MRSILFGAALFATGLGATGAQDIEVFTANRDPVTGITAAERAGARVAVHALDAPAVLEAELSAGLPADPEAAERQARRRLERLGSQQLRERVEAAFTAHRRALDYGITRYPAIVIDGEALLYGLTDVREALARYRRWQAVRP